MSAGRLAVIVFAVSFAIAEIVRPTRVVLPKRSAAFGLVQGASGYDRLLLQDLPRTRPNARGTIRVTAVPPVTAGTSEIDVSGEIVEPQGAPRGNGVFAIVDGMRMATRSSFAPAEHGGHYRIALALAGRDASHRIAVGLIRADQQGYYLLTDSAKP